MEKSFTYVIDLICPNEGIERRSIMNKFQLSDIKQKLMHADIKTMQAETLHHKLLTASEQPH